jgi:peptide/nickel transport system substrate-binding protein
MHTHRQGSSRIRVAVMLVVGALLAGGLGEPAEAKDQWVVAVPEEAESLDPQASALFTSEVYQQHIFDPLVGIEGEDLKPVGLLAERWETVNPTTWRFHLRKGVKFHSGELLDAEDVKYSMGLYTDPKGVRAVYGRPIQRVEVRDAHTVDIVTHEPFAALLTNLARLVVLPKETRAKVGAPAFAQSPVGTGAYRFGSWQRDQQLVLEANPAYWRGPVTPKRLVFRAIKDASTRAAELQASGVDVVANPPLAQLEVLDRGATQIIGVKGGRVIIYAFHLKQPPFDNAKVRQAANLAVNREAIVKNVLLGRGIVLAGPFTPAWLGFDPGVKPHAYDPARAKQLLADAGYPQGLETTWSISSGVFLKDTEVAEAVAGQLRQVGIRVTLVPTERAKIQKDAAEGTFQGITSVAWGTQFEPDPMLGWVFSKPHLGLPRLQELIPRGRLEVDPEKRRKLYQEFYQIAHEEAVWLFVHAQDELWAKRRESPWVPYSITGSKAITYYYQVPAGR